MTKNRVTGIYSLRDDPDWNKREIEFIVIWKVSVFKQMGQMFGLAKGVFCASFSCYAACR